MQVKSLVVSFDFGRATTRPPASTMPRINEIFSRLASERGDSPKEAMLSAIDSDPLDPLDSVDGLGGAAGGSRTRASAFAKWAQSHTTSASQKFSEVPRKNADRSSRK